MSELVSWSFSFHSVKIIPMTTLVIVIEFLDVIYNNVQEGRLSGVLFLDLKREFDTVDHNVVISILSKLNMSPEVLNWFHSYLTPRHQVTRVNGVDSSLQELVCGVPQSSFSEAPHIHSQYKPVTIRIKVRLFSICWWHRCCLYELHGGWNHWNLNWGT